MLNSTNRRELKLEPERRDGFCSSRLVGREQMKEVCSSACWEKPQENPNKVVCLQESGGPLLQGPLAHAGLLGAGITEGTSRGHEAAPRGDLGGAFSLKNVHSVSAVDVRARKRRHQPHLRKLGPGRRPEEAAALQLTVKTPPTPPAAPTGADAAFPPQAGEGGVDQSQVRGEKIPEEARLRPHTLRWREEAGEAVEREEVPAAQQRQQRGQDTAALQTSGKLLPLHAVGRC